MIYIKWFLLSLFNLIFKYLIAWPLTPVVVLFADKTGWLPVWLWWFQTPDNSLDGDQGWKTESRWFLNESNRFKRYINRTAWLWRNSLYGFNESVLAIHVSGDQIFYAIAGDDKVSNIPGHSGSVTRYLYERKYQNGIMKKGKMIAFHYYYVRQLKHFPKKCLRISIGWKLFGYNLPAKSSHHLALSIGLNKFVT